jgi:transcriptional regulator
MYVPAPFVEADRTRLLDLIEAHPFGLLVSTGPDGPEATHLPFLLDRAAGVLHAHLAKANPQARTLDGAPALCVFRGAHAYVSPRWYASERVVPTWAYVAVHAAGTARRVADPDRLHAMVAAMSAHFEAGAERPWTPAAPPPGHVDRLLRGIVGVEIAIERLTGARKLDQHKSAADRAGVVAGLRRVGDPDSLAVAGMIAADLPSDRPPDPAPDLPPGGAEPPP